MTERRLRRQLTAGLPPSCLRAPMIPQAEQESGARNVMDGGLRATCRGRGPSRSVSWTGTIALRVMDGDPRVTCHGRGPSRNMSWTGTLALHVTDWDPRATCHGQG